MNGSSVDFWFFSLFGDFFTRSLRLCIVGCVINFFGFGVFYYMVYRVKLRSSAGGLEHALIMAIFGFSESI